MTKSIPWLVKLAVQITRYALTGRRPVNTRMALDYQLAGLYGGSWKSSKWRGVGIQKSPADLLMYAEAMWETKPGIIVEVGTAEGGSSFWFRDTAKALSLDCEVFSIDIAEPGCRADGVTYLSGQSVDVFPRLRELVGFRINSGVPVLVSLDGDHRAVTVEKELQLYSTLVRPGGYIVVEDTVLEALTTDSPAAAVRSFLKRHPEFEVDKNKERLGLSFAPGGWLRRKA